MDRLSFIFSDIEAGSGTATDDFVEEKLLCKTIRSLFPDARKHRAELILNGDTFDFMKSPYKKTYPKHITPKVSLYKLERIAKVHHLFFQTLSAWLKNDSESRIVFVYGNHDFDLLFPEVQRKVIDIIAGSANDLRSRIVFPGFEYRDGPILAEHGSQLDEIFQVDPAQIVVQNSEGKPFLRLPWGYNALYDHYIHIKEEYPILERLCPKAQILSILLSSLRKRVVVDAATYLLKSFLYTQLRHWKDPVYRFHPRVFTKYTNKLLRKQFELHILDAAKRKLVETEINVLAVGHSHKPIVQIYAGKRILNTGTWRDEYLLSKDGKWYRPKEKTYGYIRHDGKNIKSLKLVCIQSRQRPQSVSELKKFLETEQRPLTALFSY